MSQRSRDEKFTSRLVRRLAAALLMVEEGCGWHAKGVHYAAERGKDHSVLAIFLKPTHLSYISCSAFLDCVSSTE